MPTESKIKLAIGVLVTRLEGITQANGFFTDAGETVLVNQDSTDPETLPAIGVFSGQGEKIQEAARMIKWRRVITVDGLVSTGPKDDHLIAEDLAEDMYLAIFGPEELSVKAPEKHLTGLVTSIMLLESEIAPRLDGTRTTGVNFIIEIQYVTQRTTTSQ